MAGQPVLSLFSGAGGLDLGFKRAGFEPKLAIDIDPAAVATYRYNHSQSVVRQLDLSRGDPRDLVKLWNKVIGNERPVGIIGGPPCQAFSLSNTRQRDNDPRARLLSRYAKIIAAFNKVFELDFFVFENVPGLLSKKHRRRFQRFKRLCEAAGFAIHEGIVDAGRFGVAQHRPRVIVVGVNRKRHPHLRLQIPTGDCDPLPVRNALRGLPEPAYFRRNLRASDIPYHPNHIAMVPRSKKFRNGKLTPGRRPGRSFRVLSWNAPSWTVAYGHREVDVHPGCHRRLSVLEAMLLQGFPKSYELKGNLSQQIALVADAVPPVFGEAVGEAIARTFRYPTYSHRRTHSAGRSSKERTKVRNRVR